MRSYIERAKDFIEQVYPYISECYNPWDIRNLIKNFNKTFDRKVIVSNGLSRIALITSDYVVKFDYDLDEVDNIGGCNNEVELYETAKREGFAYMFAEITPYSYNNRMFYIMPRIRGIGSGQMYAENYMDYPERHFCERYHITDLHSNNYGFRNNKICLVDYACHLSYDSDEDDSSWQTSSPHTYRS